MSSTAASLNIDQPRLSAEIEALAQISDTPYPSVTRVLFTATDMKARAYLKGLYADAGLTVREDSIGNTYARWAGTDTTAAPVGTGSHTDAIPNAGRFDGVVGVLGGLAALEALRRGGFQPRRSLEAVIFTAEEPTRFGLGCLGSRLLAGALPLDRARALRDPEGRSLEELRTAAGCAGTLETVQLPAGCYHSFVELHIEQGPLLEQEGIPIGLVEAIAGPSSYRVSLRGEGGHAGAVLM